MPLEKNAHNDFPRVARTAYIHATAVVMGKIVIGKNAFIGPYAVIRADEPDQQGEVMPIIIGDQVNIQDHVIIHALAGAETRVGAKTSLAHRALIHGPARIGCNCFVGFNSMVFKSRLGDGCVLLHHALVEDSQIPGRRLVASNVMIHANHGVRTLPRVDRALRRFADKFITTNTTLVRTYSNPGAKPS